MAHSLVGTVSSDKGDKTIIITVTERKTHPLYKKQYTVSTKFMAHDEKNQAKVGDEVLVVETRPLSARKRHKLSQILKRGGVGYLETDATSDIAEPEEKTQ